MDLSAFVGKLLEEQDGDVLREGVRVLAQALMEAEVTTLVGAERHERSEDRTAYRNGTRVRSWDTRVGTVELSIPKVRPGTYFPSLLQPRRRAEQALPTVVQEAYVHGVSTRKVDDMVNGIGARIEVGIERNHLGRAVLQRDGVVPLHAHLSDRVGPRRRVMTPSRAYEANQARRHGPAGPKERSAYNDGSPRAAYL
jgi:hypothetical protein